MYILPRQRTSPARALLRTEYRITSGYCMELYHIITGDAVLTVKTRGEDYVERNVASVTIETKVVIIRLRQGITNLKTLNT